MGNGQYQLGISVIIPAYNEEENLPLLHQKLVAVLRALGEPFEIIIVDDGSEDATFDVAARLPKVNAIKFRKNFGQSAALQCGFEQAKYDTILTIDADLQNDPADIPKLIEKLDSGYDCVSGWRHKRKDSFSKRTLSRIANFLRHTLISDNVHDSGCTLKAYKTDAVKSIKLYGEMHRYIPALIKLKGFKVTELPVNHHPRRYGRTKYNLARVFKGLMDLLVVWFWQKYIFRPIHMFGFLGVLLTFAGGFTLILLITLRLLGIISLITSTLPLLASVALILGVNVFLMGLLADISIKTYHKDIPTFSIHTIKENK